MLRIVMLLLALAFGYMLFFSTQPKSADLPPDLTRPGESARTDLPAHGQYKEAMNRVNAAAKAIQTERKEADSY